MQRDRMMVAGGTGFLVSYLLDDGTTGVGLDNFCAGTQANPVTLTERMPLWPDRADVTHAGSPATSRPTVASSGWRRSARITRRGPSPSKRTPSSCRLWIAASAVTYSIGGQTATPVSHGRYSLEDLDARANRWGPKLRSCRGMRLALRLPGWEARSVGPTLPSPGHLAKGITNEQ